MSVEWYKLSAEQALQQSGSATDGLSNDEAARRLAQHGANELHEKAHRSQWQIFLEQFKGILTVLLVIAALISAVLDVYKRQLYLPPRGRGGVRPSPHPSPKGRGGQTAPLPAS